MVKNATTPQRAWSVGKRVTSRDSFSILGAAWALVLWSPLTEWNDTAYLRFAYTSLTPSSPRLCRVPVNGLVAPVKLIDILQRDDHQKRLTNDQRAVAFSLS